MTYLINERSEAVVQSLDLLLLLGADALDGGVNLQIQGCQQALVDSHSCDGGHRFIHHASTHTSAKAYITKLHTTSSLYSTTSYKAPADLVPTDSHGRTAAAHSPVGAAHGVVLPATSIPREGAAAEALSWAPGGRLSGVGSCFHSSDRHGHRERD